MLKTVSSITNAIGALNFKGTWDANANSPALVSSVGTKGDYYVVGTAGATNLNGISNWGVGDLATFNGSVWQRVEGGADLNGVNLSVSADATISGKVRVGTTSGDAKLNLKGPVDTDSLAIFDQDTAANNPYAQIVFRKVGLDVGSITSLTTGTSYNIVSDYRLKENVLPMSGALAKINQLKPCTYTWKAGGSAGQGFIAHELADVFSDAVTGKKDEIYENGLIKPQGIDTSFLVATLVAAIQELNTELQAVKQEISTLKGV